MQPVTAIEYSCCMAKKTRQTNAELLAGAAGRARAAHFAAGGTLAEWRGRAVREQNVKRVANKNACRGHARQFLD